MSCFISTFHIPNVNITVSFFKMHVSTHTIVDIVWNSIFIMCVSKFLVCLQLTHCLRSNLTVSWTTKFPRNLIISKNIYRSEKNKFQLLFHMNWHKIFDGKMIILAYLVDNWEIKWLWWKRQWSYKPTTKGQWKRRWTIDSCCLLQKAKRNTKDQYAKPPPNDASK